MGGHSTVLFNGRFHHIFWKIGKNAQRWNPLSCFSYSALVPWAYFTGALSSAGNCLIGNSNLLTKAYFPRVAIPVGSVLAGLVDFFIASIVLGGVMVYFQIPFSWKLIFWPILVIPLMLLALGLGMLLASLNVKYRDIKYTIPFGIQLLLFVTPIIYPISIVPEKYRIFILLNPLTGIIDTFRCIVIQNKRVDFSVLGISISVVIILLLIGLSVFQNTEKRFADLV